MAKQKMTSCCGVLKKEIGCCKVESIIAIDERGQMVLPKEIRNKADIRPGDKLALVSWEKGGEVCCLSLVKVEALAEMVKTMLGPVIGEIFNKGVTK